MIFPEHYQENHDYVCLQVDFERRISELSV